MTKMSLLSGFISNFFNRNDLKSVFEWRSISQDNMPFTFDK